MSLVKKIKGLGVNLRAAVLFALVLSLLSGLHGSNVQAAAGNGYQVSPVRTDLTMAPGETKDITVYIKNVSPSPVDLKVFANDFKARDETGSPALLLNGENYPHYGLKRYMITPSGTIRLAAGERKAVSVQVKLPAGVKPGGYFGAVRFGPADSDVSSSRTVNLSANVASLVLVKVPGQVNEQLTLTGFGAEQDGHGGKFFTSKRNLQAAVRFENIGDLQEEPFGKILLKKGSTVIQSYEINNVEPKGNVLPGSIRRFSVNLDKLSNFGKYQVEGNFGYGSKGQLITASSTFYIIPLSLVIAVLVIILAVAALAFWLLKGRRRRR
jgi:hypothetical protein